MDEFGGPEVLRLVECEQPEPGQGEALIAVRRAGINFADTLTRTNSYLSAATLPLIPGTEVAGVRVADGRRVVALCGSGGYAEFTVAREALTFEVPDEITDEQAVALLIQGTTAWHLYRTAAHLAAGESVVVHSAAGGVGSLAVQLGVIFGAGRVIAAASTDAKRALALQLGAHAAIDAQPEGMTEAVLAANGGQHVDVVLDAVGGATFEASRAALGQFGRLVVYGIANREANELGTASLLRRSHAVIGFWLAHCAQRPAMLAAALDDLFAHTAFERLRPVIGATYPLAEAAQAQADLQERRSTGKLLLDPSS
jgi:NADPH:quinone reductase